MNYLMAIVDPLGVEIAAHIAREQQLPLTLVMLGRGTAPKDMMDLLGISTREKRILTAIAPSDEASSRYIRALHDALYLSTPGNGVVLSIPIKSVGGGKTMALLGKDAAGKSAPKPQYDFELIVAITNKGYTDMVMDAARAAGASGGTILHGRGTGVHGGEHFYQVSVAQEKEVILIVAAADKKAAIMKGILRQAGLDSAAETVLFSMPVSEVDGLNLPKAARD